MLLAAGLAFFLDAVILLVFGEKQRGVPKILNGVLNWDFRVIIPYDRILVAVPRRGLHRGLHPVHAVFPHRPGACGRWRRTARRRS